MSTYYSAPQEIIDIANKLITAEADLSDIKDFVPRIKFLLDDKKEDAPKKSECKKTSGMVKYFSNCDFIIVVSQILHDTISISDMEKVLHHELRHVAVKRDKNDTAKQNSIGEYEFFIRPHDVEAFKGIDDEVINE